MRDSTQPLAGIVVLDLSQVYNGPYCTFLMANAGFDPAQTIYLWENMRDTSGPRPPEFLSTHPSPDSRIPDLRRLIDSAKVLQESANRQGINPDCLP